MNRDRSITEVVAEPVAPDGEQDLSHLSKHRGLIIRRALLASAIRGFLPVPMLDDTLANRVAAGLFAKLAAGHQVDLPPASAALLAERWSGGTGSRLTFAAAAALVAKFAGRKFLALLAAGRGAEDMARTFHRATLFDHYCAKLHVGGPISAETVTALAAQVDAELRGMPLGPALAAFTAGGRIMGRSLLEAPRWVSRRLSSLAERFVHSGGNPDAVHAVPVPESGEDAWLDRAAQAVEDALAHAGNQHLLPVVRGFEARWRQERQSASASGSSSGNPSD